MSKIYVFVEYKGGLVFVKANGEEEARKNFKNWAKKINMPEICDDFSLKGTMDELKKQIENKGIVGYIHKDKK